MALLVAEGLDDVTLLAQLSGKKYWGGWTCNAGVGSVATTLARWSDGRASYWGNYSYIDWKPPGPTYPTELFVSYAFHHSTFETDYRNVIVFRDILSGDAQASVYFRGGSGLIGSCRGYVGGAFIGDCSPATPLAALGWYWVCVHFKLGDSDGIIKVWVNGSLVLNLVNVDTKNTAASRIDSVFFDQGTGADFNWDDMIICDGTGDAPFNNVLLAERRIVTRFANADGTYSDWTKSTGSTSYGVVDETTPNDDTDYLSSATVGQKTLVGFSDIAASPQAIEAVWPSIRARKDDTVTREIRDVLRTNGNDYNGDSRALTSAWVNYNGVLRLVNPQTGSPWTESEFNAVEAGPEVVT